MRYWIRDLYRSIKFRKIKRTVSTFARDKYGRWMIDDKSGKIILKTDDPKVIERAKAKSEERYEEVIKVLKEERTCACGNDGMCPCEKGSKMRHPANNEGRLPHQQADWLLEQKKNSKKKKS